MKKIKIMTVFGTRPEAIKMAPLVKELKKRPEIDTIVCVTAQHRQMLDQVLDTFGIVPDFDLDVMKERQTLPGITSSVLLSLDDVIKNVQPDMMLVHGDTTTTMSSALAAYYNQVALGHVEAGLRTNNKYSPFPEEMNRKITGDIADLHFAPTLDAKENLLREGKADDTIFVTGNTAIDALQTTVSNAYSHDMLTWANDAKLVMLTAHRRENLGENMYQMFTAIRRIVEEHEDVKVIYPVHLNPVVQEMAQRVLNGHERVRLVPPMEVVDFHNFLAKSYFILTDSGGIQEEAPSLGKPVIVLRDTTERPEGVAAGTLVLAGTEEEKIYKVMKELLEDDSRYQKMATAKNPYGDGKASIYIVDEILRYFTNNKVV